MSKKKRIKDIAVSTQTMGNILATKYYTKGNLDNAKEAIRAYNAALKAHTLLIKL